MSKGRSKGTKQTDNQTVREDYKKQLEELMKHPLIQESPIRVLGNGEEVTIKSPTHILKKTLIKHGMQEEDMEPILEEAREFRVLNSRITQTRLKAEGVTRGSRHTTKALERSQELLDLFGKYYNAKEVHQVVTQNWGLTNLTYNWVVDFKNKNAEYIAELREKYAQDHSNVRLGHKRSRLDELTYMYQTRKQKYDGSSSREDENQLLKIVEQIRKEIEGNKLTIDGSIAVQNDITLQNHVNQEMIKYLNINDLIISRLCARMGISPKLILHRLHNSYYKKFTGFTQVEGDNDYQEIQYPSSMVYDFGHIKDMHKSVKVEEVPFEEVEEVPEPEKEKVLTVKEKLLAKLKEQKEKVEKNKVLTDVVEAKDQDSKRNVVRIKRKTTTSKNKVAPKKTITRKKPGTK